MFGRTRRRLELELAKVDAQRRDLDDTLREYERFHRWAARHAPATLRRYEEHPGGGKMPRWRLTMIEQADKALKDAYAPSIRAMLQAPQPLFMEILRTDGVEVVDA